MVQPWELEPWEGYRWGSAERLREAVKARRLELGLTMAEAAERCGISFAAYRASEETLTCFSAERIWRLAWGLDVMPKLFAAVAGYPTEILRSGEEPTEWGSEPGTVAAVLSREPE